MMQEILDQIADIDLVVNFKCTEDCLLNQHMRTGIYSPGKEFLSMSKSGYPSSSSSDAEGAWKDKLSMRAEQVHISYCYWIRNKYANSRRTEMVPTDCNFQEYS